MHEINLKNVLAKQCHPYMLSYHDLPHDAEHVLHQTLSCLMGHDGPPAHIDQPVGIISSPLTSMFAPTHIVSHHLLINYLRQKLRVTVQYRMLKCRDLMSDDKRVTGQKMQLRSTLRISQS